jgi:hypothetical protein
MKNLKWKQGDIEGTWESVYGDLKLLIVNREGVFYWYIGSMEGETFKPEHDGVVKHKSYAKRDIRLKLMELLGKGTDNNIEDLAGSIGCCMWFIKKMGSVARAKRVFAASIAALESTK